MFPFLNRKMDFHKEADEHKVIHDTIEAILAFLTAAKADHSKFDAAHFKQMLTEFREPLYAHLDEEVEHLDAKNMTVFDKKELEEKTVSHLVVTNAFEPTH